MSQVPIILNTFNTFASLKGMVEYLRPLGEDIFIVDNGSTYPPLLDWYATKPVTEVLRLDHNNWRHRAPWESRLVERVMSPKGKYVVSDPDLDLTGVPIDMLDVLKEALDRYPSRTKVGLSLRIDDLPDANPIKNTIVGWEKQWWHRKVGNNFYDASIDTTFAMYRVGQKARVGGRHSDLRTAPPYCCRHLPWYMTEDNLTDEDIFRYSLSDLSGHWSPRLKQLVAKYQAGRSNRMEAAAHVTHSHFALKTPLYDTWDGYAIPHWSRKYEYPWAAKFVQAAPEPAKLHVFDACCGWEPTTFFKYWLAERCAKVYAVDADPQLLRQPNNFSNLDFIVHRLGETPTSVPAESCDLVFCISALEHMPRHLHAPIVEEFYRVLKPGGQAIITLDWPDVNLDAWFDIINSSRFQWHGPVDKGPPDDRHVSIRRGQHIAGPQSIRIKRALRVFCSVLVKPGKFREFRQEIQQDPLPSAHDSVRPLAWAELPCGFKELPSLSVDEEASSLPENTHELPELPSLESIESIVEAVRSGPIYESPVTPVSDQAEEDVNQAKDRYGKPKKRKK